jgi:Tol biopolymer transport system component
LGCEGLDADARPDARLPGKIFFYTWSDTGCAQVRLLEDGILFVLAAMPQDERRVASQTMTVSPDGSRVVWVTNENRDYLGDLALFVFGHPSGPRLLGGQVLPWSPPQWEADSRHIVANTLDATFRIDTDTGFSEPIAPGVIYNLLSPGGAYAANADGGEVVVVRSDGAPLRRVTYGGGGEGGFSVQGVSNDGRYVVIGAGGSDPTRVLGGAVLLDMITGGPAPLPMIPPVGSLIRPVVPAPDGGMLITTSTIDADDQARVFVVTPSGVVAQQASAPGLTGPIVLYLQ